MIYKANANHDEFYKTIQKRVEKKSDDCKAVILAELEKSQLRITEIDKAIPHKDCATDASSNFSSDETKSGVNT